MPVHLRIDPAVGTCRIANIKANFDDLNLEDQLNRTSDDVQCYIVHSLCRTSAVKISRSCLFGTVISSSGTFAKRFATSPPETWSIKPASVNTCTSITGHCQGSGF